jgi:hypothetical protein
MGRAGVIADLLWGPLGRMYEPMPGGHAAGPESGCLVLIGAALCGVPTEPRRPELGGGFRLLIGALCGTGVIVLTELGGGSTEPGDSEPRIR